jgi:hypothetical protein
MAVHNPEQPKKFVIYFFKLICTSSRNMISVRYVGMVIHVDCRLFLKTMVSQFVESNCQSDT